MNIFCFYLQIIKNKDEDAVKSIQWLRGKDYEYRAEIEELRETQEKIKQNQVSWMEGLSRPVTRKALFISLGLMFFQQLSGINAVIFYSAKIFEVSIFQIFYVYNEDFKYCEGALHRGPVYVRSELID